MTPTNVRGDPLVNLKTSRVEALSDGVFAIAMTILVLNISVPTAETVSADRLADALGRVAAQVIAYIISFVNLGVLWVGQHNQYHFIDRADRWFLWINILYLLLAWFSSTMNSTGGLTLAMAVTLFLVPVFGLDLRIVDGYRVPHGCWPHAAAGGSMMVNGWSVRPINLSSRCVGRMRPDRAWSDPKTTCPIS